MSCGIYMIYNKTSYKRYIGRRKTAGGYHWEFVKKE